MASAIVPANIRQRIAQQSLQQKANYQLEFTLATSGKPVSNLKFSPNGKYLARTSTFNRELEIWDFTKREVMKIIRDPIDNISCFAWSPDSSMIVTGNYNKNLILWDRASGKALRQLKGHTLYIVECEFNPKGTIIASSSQDKTIKTWDVRTGIQLSSLASPDLITSVSFNPCGDLLATTCHDGVCRILETASGATVRKFRERRRTPMTFGKFCPNGKHVITTSLYENAVKLWGITDERCLRSYVGHQSINHCSTVDFCRVGTQSIVSGSEDYKLYVWDYETATLEQTLVGHSSIISDLTCHPTEPIIASGGLRYDRSIKIWKNKL